MPTPDGRSWLTSKQIGIQIAVFFCHEFEGEAWFDGGEPWHIDADMDAETFNIVPDGNPFPAGCMLATPGVKQRFWDALRDGFKATGYTTEFKLVRLWEKLKDRIMSNDITDMTQVKSLITGFYDKDVLDTLDEDGELLP